jgi:hypothetical protein
METVLPDLNRGSFQRAERTFRTPHRTFFLFFGKAPQSNLPIPNSHRQLTVCPPKCSYAPLFLHLSRPDFAHLRHQ